MAYNDLNLASQNMGLGVNSTNLQALAAEIAKNNAGEQSAIEGYFQLLTAQGLPQEFINDINEIISDEMNHTLRLSHWTEQFSGVLPAKT